MRVEFVSDRMSYIILGDQWCDIIALNVHVPMEDTIDDTKSSSCEDLEHAFNQLPQYHIKILSGDFSAKVDREDIFKPTTENKSLYKISKGNAISVVNFGMSKNLTLKSTMFPHYNIHKFTWTSPDRETHNQTEHILIDRRYHSSVPDSYSFRGADCHPDHYLVVAEVWERLAISK
jgi:hypothetical protein